MSRGFIPGTMETINAEVLTLTYGSLASKFSRISRETRRPLRDAPHPRPTDGQTHGLYP